MPCFLNPERDILFTFNSMVKISDFKNVNHFRNPNGKQIVDSEIEKPFSNFGMHIYGSNKKFQEKLESMAQAIFLREWSWFDSLSEEIKELKPSQKVLDNFGYEQMKAMVACDPNGIEFGALSVRLRQHQTVRYAALNAERSMYSAKTML